MKQRVHRWTGLPIGVGISTTKALTKLANYAAKRYPATGGVVDLTCPSRQQRLMDITPVGEVWGVGRRIGARLEAAGIHTAAQLAAANRGWIKKQFSVVLERTAGTNLHQVITLFRVNRGNNLIDYTMVVEKVLAETLAGFMGGDCYQGHVKYKG